MKTLTNLKTWSTRAKNATAALLFLTAYTISMVAPFIPVQTASAAPACIVDLQGNGDEPGQKDLTQMCIDSATGQVSWNWDETSVNGANTLDACALFDTDGDGYVNKALCVTSTNGVAFTKTAYVCNDSRVDRCAGADAGTPATSACALAIVTPQVFAGGDAAPNDLKATCTPTTADTSGGTMIDVCSYPSQQPNSDPSDCIIYRDKSARIEVQKILNPTDDPGKFNLIINSTTYATNVGNGGTTGEKVLNSGSITVAEAAGTGTSLTGYTTSVVCKDGNGTGTIVGQGTPTSTTSRALTFTAADASDIVCVFTNTRQTGTITLVKSVINNNGGTLGVNDFGLTIGGNAVTSGQAVTLPAGVPVAINEAGANGYAFVSITGDQYSSCPTSLGGTVTPVSGQNITCTITNDDQAATLIVNKVLVNDNGGTKTVQNFSYNVNGGTAVPFEADGSNSQAVNAGTYSIGEVADSGYTTTYANSLNGYANCTNLVIPNGGTATCTITNNDIPAHLTLVKNLIKDNGGTAAATDWTLKAVGPTPLSGVTGNVAVTNATVSAGTYNLSETGGPAGYTASNWVCTGGTQNGAAVTLASGQSASCTITNNDNSPYLQLVKTVTNDNGGTAENTAWTLIATGNTQATSFQGTTGVNSTSVTNFLAGSYALSESGGPSGYTAGSWSCTGGTAIDGVIQLILGQSAVCTINNNDNAPKLTLNKVVVNDNGGAAHESDWTLTANGGTAGTLSGPGAVGSTDVVSGVGFKAGTYTLSESGGPSGYTASAWSCTGGKTPNAYNQITMNLGDDVTCTITNDDQAGKLIVKKVLVNDNGGTKSVVDFSYKINNGSSVPFEADASNSHTISAGTYSVAEVADGSYTTTYANSSNGYTNCSDLSVPNGGEVTCTITNNDNAPSLTLVKHVTNNNGGTKVATDWNLSAVGPTSISGAGGAVSGTDFKIGTYTLGETSISGYHVGINWSCAPIANTGTSITLGLGQSTTCEITNDDNPASLSGTKTVTNTDLSWTTDGKPPVSGWVIYLDQNQNGVLDQDERKTTTDANGNYNFGDLVAGVNYYVKEVLNSLGSGWAQITGPTNPVNLTLGQNSAGNNFSNEARGTITVIKNVDDGFGNVTQDVTNWTWDYSGTAGNANNVSTGSGNDQTVPAGTYMVSEDQKPGYHVIASSCSDDYTPYPESRSLSIVLPQTSKTVTVGPGENVTCEFTNKRDTGSVTIVKDAQPDSSQAFKFNVEATEMENSQDSLAVVSSETPAVSASSSFNLVDSGDQSGSEEKTLSLATGWYRVNEEAVKGWDLSDISCGETEWQIGDNGNLYVYVGKNTETTCTFTNIQRAQLTVVKDVQPDSTKIFTFKTDVAQDELGADLSFSLTDNGSNLGTNMKKFEDVLPGTYTVTEDQLSGWKLDNIACTGTGVTMTRDGAKLTVTLVAGAVATCTFVNSFIPQVLADTFTLPTLVNTGNSTLAVMFLALTLILMSTGFTLISRRKATSA